MRKFFTYFLMIILVAGTLLSTVACGGGGSEKPGDITGVVRWLDPTPAGSIGIKDVTVNVWDENDKKVSSGITDEKGKFSINDVPVGTYTVTAYAPAGVEEEIEKRWLKSSVTVQSDREITIEFTYQNAVGDKLPAKYLP
jgi:hypothetical protein